MFAKCNIMSKRKKVFLGAYIQNNLGDDMFVQCVANRYPDVDFYLYADSSYVNVFSAYKNIHVMPQIFIFIDRVLNKIFGKKILKKYLESKYKYSVHIGGSIFIEPADFKRQARIFTHPNQYYIGCNFGPYRTCEYLDYVSRKISLMRDICFRDSYSYNVFRTFNHVRYASDVLWGYYDYPNIVKGDRIGISVIELEHREDLKDKADIYYQSIAEIIDICINNDKEVTLFSFCKQEGDERAINKILKLLGECDVEICCHNSDVRDTIEAINRCEYIMASRFHAMIIGLRLKKKVFPIIYSDKQLNVLEDMGVSSCWNLREEQWETPWQLYNKCLISKSIENIEYFIKDSERQFEALDFLLKNLSEK